MSILKDVFAELFSMFVSDRGLVAAVLIVVGVAALLTDGLHKNPLIGGAILFGGCLLTLIHSVYRRAKTGG